MQSKIESSGNGTIAVPLSKLAEELLANARLAELPFDYDYDTWVLGKDSMRFLVALVRRTAPRKVIEYGSGVSTRVLAHELRERCVIRSFDHVADFASRTRAALGSAAGNVEVLHRSIGLRCFDGKVLPFYGLATPDYAAVREADLVFVDGPPGPWGREAALYSAFPVMREGGLLVLDDAGRPGERAAAAAWRRYFGDAVEMQFVPSLGKGMLIVRKRGVRAAGRGFTWAERLGALRHSLRALWRHRPRWLRRARAHG
jgi:predicted O-methyltransferase YrrM